MRATSEVTARSGTQQCDDRETLVSCLRCGQCCTGRHVRLSRTDAQRIAHGLGVAWQDFHDRYLDPVWASTGTLALRQRHGRCIFLRYDDQGHVATCLVHPFKPTICRLWAPGLHRRECREALAMRCGATASPSASFKVLSKEPARLVLSSNPW